MNTVTPAGHPHTPVDTRTIPGWGVDADERNDPTYPFRDRARDDHATVWPRPVEQQPRVEILQSIEHVRQPAVVGTSTPPSGVSGAIRRAAFRWSESNLLHWMLLLGADRVNVVEGLVEDVARGKLPNVLAEMGIAAEWQHNKAGLLRKAAIGAGVIGAIALLRARKAERTRIEG